MGLGFSTVRPFLVTLLYHAPALKTTQCRRGELEVETLGILQAATDVSRCVGRDKNTWKHAEEEALLAEYEFYEAQIAASAGPRDN